MSCTNCNSAAHIEIGRKHYCSNCGEILSGSTVANKPWVSPVAHVAPVAPQRLIRDLGGPARPTPQVAAPRESSPADKFHAQLKPAKGGVLDLRGSKPKTIAAAAVHTYRAIPKPPTPRPVAAKPAETVKAKAHTSVAAKAMHSPAKAQVSAHPTEKHDRARRVAKHHEAAAAIQRSERISRFGTAPSSKPVPSASGGTVHSARAEEVELPRYAAAQHEHLSRLIEVMKTESPTGHRQATKPSRASFAAAAAAIAIIGGYIWLHNYPELALTSASSKAGFSASLPSFVPSSYSLNGSPSYSPGLVTLNFKSPSFTSPLNVTQQPTTWDSSSLLDNYVVAKTSSYTAVTGQGLTIYLLNDNKEATWVNHGIWYHLSGITNVSRDQLLKMAYSF